MNKLFDLTILYVEDELIVREPVASFLQSIFKEVIVAYDGLNGLEKYKLNHNTPQPIDLVITDITMPNMNGFEMVKEMRKINNDLQAIITTGLDLSDHIDGINMISVGNYFIKKPIVFENFIPLVESIIERINEKKEYRKEYSLSKQYLNAMDYSAIVTKTDKSGVITYANDAFCQISGYKREELIGKNHNIVRDPSVPKEFYADMWKIIKAKMIYRHPSIPNRAKNGKIYYVNTTITPILDEFRHVSEYISIRFDTTDLELQQRADKAALQTQEKFLANMSHEIRTPLNGILGFARILEEEIQDNDLKEYASIINKSGKNLLELINQILDLSKINNGHMELDNHWIDLHSELISIKRLFEFNAKEKNITIECSLHDQKKNGVEADIEVLTDGLKLKQVISNLLGNAIKFTPKNGKIEFNVREIKRDDEKIKVRFSITDNGIGIPKSKQAHIFEPFKQADLSTTREYGGTGLGLALSKDFVSLMGGNLELESAPQVGSEFYFTLQFEYRKKENVVEVENTKEKDHSDAPKYILLAEDVQINQKLTEIYLQELGYKVIHADNGIEAIKHFKDKCKMIEAVLLDIDMPVMDGKEACLEIKKYKELHHCEMIPIIAVTSDESLKNEERYLQFGFDYFISKPINSDLLQSMLNPKGKNNIFSKKQQVVQKCDPKQSHSDLLEGTILVAEDVEVNQKLIGILLKNLGLKPIFASNGLEATAIFQKEYDNIDCVLLDINMPVMDGNEACKAINTFKEARGILGTPCIALTANAVMGDKEKYLANGFDEYLAKPVESEKLKMILQKYLSTRCEEVDLKEENSSILKQDEKREEIEKEEKIDFQNNADKLSLPLEFYMELLEDCCKLFGQEIPKLEFAIEILDFDDIKEIAHKLKGVAGNLALDDVYSDLKIIDERALDNDLTDIKELTDKVKNRVFDTLCK